MWDVKHNFMSHLVLVERQIQQD